MPTRSSISIAFLRVGAAEAAVDAEQLADLEADRPHRVESREGVLEDDRDVVGAHAPAGLLVEFEEVDAVEPDLAAVMWAGGVSRMPIMAWLVTDLPEPDSPTMARVRPSSRVKLAPRTAGMRMPAGGTRRGGRPLRAAGGWGRRREACRRRRGCAWSCGHLSFGSRASRRASPKVANANTVMSRKPSARPQVQVPAGGPAGALGEEDAPARRGRADAQAEDASTASVTMIPPTWSARWL